MPRSKFAAAVIVTALLGGCSMWPSAEEADLIAQFAPLNTEAQFLSDVVGPTWQADEIKVVFDSDGTLSGTVNGVEVTGTWVWRDTQFCSTFRVATAGGEGCSELGLREGELLVVPRGGTGAPYTYTRL